MDKINKIEVHHSDGVIEEAEGDDANAIFRAWEDGLVFKAIHGFHYKGPKMKVRCQSDASPGNISDRTRERERPSNLGLGQGSPLLTVTLGANAMDDPITCLSPIQKAAKELARVWQSLSLC